MKFACMLTFVNPAHFLEIAPLGEEYGWDTFALSDHVVNLDVIEAKYPYGQMGGRMWARVTLRTCQDMGLLPANRRLHAPDSVASDGCCPAPLLSPGTHRAVTPSGGVERCTFQGQRVCGAVGGGSGAKRGCATSYGRLFGRARAPSRRDVASSRLTRC